MRLIKGDANGYGWLMQVMIIGSGRLGSWVLLQSLTNMFVDVKMFKPLLFSFVSSVSHCPCFHLGVHQISGLVYLIVKAIIGVYR